MLIGLPGAGKSTVGSLLARATGGLVAGENPSTFEYVEDALSDPVRYAALNQVEFMLDKARTELAPELGLVWEEDDTRYLHHVWTYALVSDGRIDARATDLLEKLASVLDATCPQPNGILALELDLPALERRILARGRPYETIAGELDDGLRRLLAALHRKHQDYVTSRSVEDPPLWSIDASQAPAVIVAEVLAHVRTLGFIPATFAIPTDTYGRSSRIHGS